MIAVTDLVTIKNHNSKYCASCSTDRSLFRFDVPCACLSDSGEGGPGIEVGMKKIQVLNLLGPADVRNTFVKQTEQIWGPQEAWWDQVQMGDSLESWLYIYPDEGTLYVYFLNESNSVSFMAFTPEGVVY